MIEPEMPGLSAVRATIVAEQALYAEIGSMTTPFRGGRAWIREVNSRYFFSRVPALAPREAKAKNLVCTARNVESS